MPNLGVPELLIVLLIVMLLFGSSRVTDLAGSLGKSIREFRHGMEGDETKSAEPPQIEPPVAFSPTPTSTPLTEPKRFPQVDLLTDLQRLKEAGVITEEEFQAKKTQLLDKI